MIVSYVAAEVLFGRSLGGIYSKQQQQHSCGLDIEVLIALRSHPQGV
jgi:hypothetical protein